MLGSILDPFGGPAEASFRRNLVGPAKVPDLVDEDDVDLGREVFGDATRLESWSVLPAEPARKISPSHSSAALVVLNGDSL